MGWKRVAGLGVIALVLSGCSSLEFSDGFAPNGVTFYDPEPILVRKCDKDGEEVIEVAAMPGRPRSVRPRAGVIGADLSAHFSNGMISEFGQHNESLDPELLSTIAGLGGLGGPEKIVGLDGAAPAETYCASHPPTRLYSIRYEGGRIVGLAPLVLGEPGA